MAITRILKLDHDDPRRELEFELDYLVSLTSEERYRLMLRRWTDALERMIRNGHLRPIEIIASLDDLFKMKRAANRPKDKEDLVALQELEATRSQATKIVLQSGERIFNAFSVYETGDSRCHSRGIQKVWR